MSQEGAETDADRTDVLAYLRVSTDEQGRSGLGLDAQRTAIEDAAKGKRWNVARWIEDRGESGKSLERPGIQEALALMEDSGPDVLVAAKLDRLSRSAIDFMTLVKRAREHGWALVVLDLGVDMTTPVGKFVAGVMAQVAELERDMIRERTRAALEAAQQRGTHVGRPPWGFMVNPRRDESGEPQLLPDLDLFDLDDTDAARQRIVDTVRTMRDRREQDDSYQAIADHLNAEGVPTSTGRGRWHPTSVRNVLLSYANSPAIDLDSL